MTRAPVPLADNTALLEEFPESGSWLNALLAGALDAAAGLVEWYTQVYDARPPTTARRRRTALLLGVAGAGLIFGIYRVYSRRQRRARST